MKPPPIYNQYLISENGKVFSTKRKEIKQLTIGFDKRGYPRVKITKSINDGIYIRVHRLVAETYLENPNNLPQVNHIDEDKTNNCVSNLEWWDNKTNCQHSKCKYKWKIINIETNEIYETNSLNDFCKQRGFATLGLHSTLPCSKKLKPHFKNFKIIDRIRIKP